MHQNPSQYDDFSNQMVAATPQVIGIRFYSNKHHRGADLMQQMRSGWPLHSQESAEWRCWPIQQEDVPVSAEAAAAQQRLTF